MADMGGPEVPTGGRTGEVLTKLDDTPGYGGATGWRPVAAQHLEARVAHLERLVKILQNRLKG